MRLLVKEVDIVETGLSPYSTIIQYLIYVVDNEHRLVKCDTAYGESQKYEVMSNFLGYYDIDIENIQYVSYNEWSKIVNSFTDGEEE